MCWTVAIIEFHSRYGNFQAMLNNWFYLISSVMHAFRLVLTYDLLEDRRIDDVIIKTFFRIF